MRAAVKHSGNKNQSSRLAEQALSTLEELFVTLQLPPGSVWSEVGLSERLEIGRTPVREAIQILAQHGLLIPIRRHGIMISKIDVHEQLFVNETRRELERLLAVCAARRATSDEKLGLSKLANKMEMGGRRGAVHAFMRLHFEVKRRIAELSGNAFAARAMTPLLTLSRRFYFAHYRELNDLPMVAQLHADLAQAVACSDEEAAATLSDKLMDYAQAFTKRIAARGL